MAQKVFTRDTLRPNFKSVLRTVWAVGGGYIYKYVRSCILFRLGLYNILNVFVLFTLFLSTKHDNLSHVGNFSAPEYLVHREFGDR